ncbi:MAG: CTP synthase (glutamine hydrolyzing) [Candidatus Thermoplasmatota archaeon]|nr:CTP synthase (glutamine hydrolyzing) [Candidatus Thermoplasmatota archaeon]MCL5962768.1 CTP synthase (glutamine hydrolyzing) [Candidatus Thermoplasmatota archaeon]
MKYIVVTGGVISGLGKGITTSSIGRLLISAGLKVVPIKIDPYINCDAGTMNPFQHGEVFVLDDGGEVDLDLGNYERFMDVSLTKDDNITTGKVYLSVIERERKGEYLGDTVQIIPHITGEIKHMIRSVGIKANADVVLIEVGGTVGDIESMPFLEALRELKMEVGDENILFIHTTLIPVVGSVGEQKTKPTQRSVKELRSTGIQPAMIVARGTMELDMKAKHKLKSFCEVAENAIFNAPDMDSIYDVPIHFEKQNMLSEIKEKLKLNTSEINSQKWDEWKAFVNRLKHASNQISVAVIGKYTDLKDAYLSYNETFHHCSAETDTKINVEFISAEDIEKCDNLDTMLSKFNGILIPGGFGNRGTEGKIKAIEYARVNNRPFLGVCLGFQMAVIEYSRNVLGLKDANSTEFSTITEHPVIDLLPEQVGVTDKGATMRLGSHAIKIKEGSFAYNIYNKNKIYERHRHRYEVNPEYIEKLEKHGLIFSATDIEDKRMEICEIRDKKFFIATQFHPELKSRPMAPAPVYLAFVKSMIQ